MSEMNRRDFIRTGVASGAVISLPGCNSYEEPRVPTGTTRPFQIPDFPLEEMTIADLSSAMGRGDYTCREIMELYLERIEILDRQGPQLFSVLEVNPSALSTADGIDRDLRNGTSKGPLHGIPVLLKDNIDTADQMTTTAGSTALRGSTPPRDAFIADKLRAAGAVLLGKANMSEWAGFKSFERGTSGWSGRGWDGGRGRRRGSCDLLAPPRLLELAHPQPFIVNVDPLPPQHAEHQREHPRRLRVERLQNTANALKQKHAQSDLEALPRPLTVDQLPSFKEIVSDREAQKVVAEQQHFVIVVPRRPLLRHHFMQHHLRTDDGGKNLRHKVADEIVSVSEEARKVPLVIPLHVVDGQAPL